jgi:peptidoglycan biosynthesis protein MviN/MurJ (putative lipid II flippase)
MIIAKGDFKLFLIIELSTDVIILLSNTILYHYFQLEGIGIASLINNVFRFFFQITILNIKYSFSFENSCLKILIVQIILATTIFLFVSFWGFPLSYIMGGVIFLASIMYTYIELKKRIELSTILRK